MDLEFYDIQHEQYIPMESVEIVVLTDKVTMGISSVGFMGSFNAEVSRDDIQEL